MTNIWDKVFKNRTSKNFTWFILEYFVPFIYCNFSFSRSKIYSILTNLICVTFTEWILNLHEHENCSSRHYHSGSINVRYTRGHNGRVWLKVKSQLRNRPQISLLVLNEFKRKNQLLFPLNSLNSLKSA